MNKIEQALVVIALVTAAVVAADAVAKGAGAAGKASGWSLTPASSASGGIASSTANRGSGGKARAGSVQGFALPAGPAPGMAGMMMTPNGMIVHNTPPMAVANATNMGGSSLVAHMAPGVGNTVVTGAARGVGNSQGSGGTLDIAQMTHFGVNGVSMLGAMLGLSGGGGLGSLLPASPTGGGASAGSGAGAIKASMGLPTNNACTSPTGKKGGCG